ncbi:MAG TPA: hypothetical protein VGK29_27785 [Paludibaculum sp.]
MQFVLAVSLACSAMATTLERLTLDEMIQKSTAIVRGKVLDFSTVQRGNIVYTVYRLQVSERLKGGAGLATTEVFLPGGTIGGYRQSFAGTPQMERGAEYVVFVWVSPKGIPQVVGLGQGVFDVKISASGQTILSRGPLEAEVLTPFGQPVVDQGLKLTLDRLRTSAAAAEASK